MKESNNWKNKINYYGLIIGAILACIIYAWWIS